MDGLRKTQLAGTSVTPATPALADGVGYDSTGKHVDVLPPVHFCALAHLALAGLRPAPLLVWTRTRAWLANAIRRDPQISA